MALNKIITDERGVITSYHKIANLSIFKKNSSENNEKSDYNLYVQIASYVSEEIRQESELLTANSTHYSLECSYEELNTTPAFALAYAKLKELPIFEGAEDC